VQHLTERHRFELCVQSLFHQLLESRNLVVHFRVSFAQISVSLLLLISTRLRDSDVPELPKAILILVRTDDVEQIEHLRARQVGQQRCCIFLDHRRLRITPSDILQQPLSRQTNCSDEFPALIRASNRSSVAIRSASGHCFSSSVTPARKLGWNSAITPANESATLTATRGNAEYKARSTIRRARSRSSLIAG
jgi:hypothetical protein